MSCRALGTAHGFLRWALAFRVASLLARVRPATACRHPLRPHIVHHFTFLISVRGGWGADSLEGAAQQWLSAARPRLCTVCCLLPACGTRGSAGSRNCIQPKLLCVCSSVCRAKFYCAAHRMLARAAAAAVARRALFHCILREYCSHGLVCAMISISACTRR